MASDKAERKEPFLAPGEEEQLVAAIGRAEAHNRGEVRIHLEDRCPGESLARAREVFFQLDMDRTRDGTGVLLYVATDDRKIAVFAGPGIHGAAAPDFWQGVVDALAGGFAQGERIAGLSAALDKIGDLLRQEVPGADEAGNELPDAVTRSAGAPS